MIATSSGPCLELHFPEGEIHIRDLHGTLSIERLFVPSDQRRRGNARRLLKRVVAEADRQGLQVDMHICPDAQGITEDERRAIALGLIRVSARLGFKSLELEGETYQMDRHRPARPGR